MRRVALGYWTLLLVLAVVVHLVAKDLVVDEVFHVAQAGRFLLDQNLDYDPKLTTPPGLYLWSCALLVWVRRFITRSELATWTRATNTIFGALFPFLIKQVLHRDPGRSRTLEPWTLSLFPVLFFFYFVYYTDVGSVFFLLGSWQRALTGHYLHSAMLGAVSILFRQTNIVWLAFFAACALLNLLRLEHPDTRNAQSFWKTLWKMLQQERKSVLSLLASYLPVGLAFLVFLRWNGGITLGDKENHEVTLHIMQLPYLALFTQLMALPHVTWTHRCGWCISILHRLVLCFVVARYTIEHPFLLADNRHYPHILWRLVIRPYPIVKYFLVEAYARSIESLVTLLVRARGKIWTFAFIGATALTLVPSPLIEPRYFIVPFMIFRLSIPRPSRRAIRLELAFFAVMNAATMGLFFFKTFEWPSAPGQVQRIIW